MLSAILMLGCGRTEPDVSLPPIVVVVDITIDTTDFHWSFERDTSDLNLNVGQLMAPRVMPRYE